MWTNFSDLTPSSLIYNKREINAIAQNRIKKKPCHFKGLFTHQHPKASVAPAYFRYSFLHSLPVYLALDIHLEETLYCFSNSTGPSAFGIESMLVAEYFFLTKPTCPKINSFCDRNGIDCSISSSPAFSSYLPHLFRLAWRSWKHASMTKSTCCSIEDLCSVLSPYVRGSQPPVTLTSSLCRLMHTCA